MDGAIWRAVTIAVQETKSIGSSILGAERRRTLLQKSG